MLEHFRAASHPVVKGFMIGRSVWQAPLEALLGGSIDEAECRTRIAGNFQRLIDGWIASHPAQEKA